LRATVYLPVSRLAFRRKLERVRALKDDAVPVGVDRLPSITVINLATRPERLSSFTREMDRLGIKAFRRLEGIPNPNGAIGCASSHAHIVREVIDRSLPSAMICEDDVRFLISRDELDVLVEAFLDDDQAEIACLEFNAQKTRHYSSLYLRATETQNAGCYLVKATIANDLLGLVDEGIDAMARGGDPLVHSIDVVWKKLQKTRVFLVPIERVAYQEASYSDIEHRFVSRRTGVRR
jgi:Glycosyltransferase family 25 (LPS biosynthesis protein)